MTNQKAENELTAEIADTNYFVGMRQALDRLEQNPDFSKVVLEGYFKNEAIRGVSLLANDSIRQRGARPEVMERLVAISSLQDFFLTIKSMAPTEEELAEDEYESTEE